MNPVQLETSHWKRTVKRALKKRKKERPRSFEATVLHTLGRRVHLDYTKKEWSEK